MMMMTVDDFPLTSDDDIYTPICDDGVMCFTSFPFFSSLLRVLVESSFFCLLSFFPFIQNTVIFRVSTLFCSLFV